MKILLVIILLLVTTQGFTQFSKKKKAKKEAEQAAAMVDPRDSKIDSLTTANILLAANLDSVTKNEQLYYGLYVTIKEKVLLKDFDPTRLGLIIDSLRASRDAATTLQDESTGAAKTSVLVMGASAVELQDSLSRMTHENKLLTTKVETLELEIKAVERKNLDKLRLVSELKDLKGLLDSKLISQTDYEIKKKQVMDKWQ